MAGIERKGGSFETGEDVARKGKGWAGRVRGSSGDWSGFSLVNGNVSGFFLLLVGSSI